jgi:hypothetical protein
MGRTEGRYLAEFARAGPRVMRRLHREVEAVEVERSHTEAATDEAPAAFAAQVAVVVVIVLPLLVAVHRRRSEGRTAGWRARMGGWKLRDAARET